ncbi:MAG: hypothetical protein Q8Q62_02690, partial [Mesorhizobium sp.]|nr:hypothetical protein [Mesorhizobium sp.]
MGRRVTEAQWFCARAVSEGEPATRIRVAGILGVDVSHVYMRAAAEGWKTVDFRNQDIRALYREAQAIAAALSGDDAAGLSGDDAASFAATAEDFGGADGAPDAADAVPYAGGADAARDEDGAALDAGGA